MLCFIILQPFPPWHPVYLPVLSIVSAVYVSSPPCFSPFPTAVSIWTHTIVCLKYCSSLYTFSLLPLLLPLPSTFHSLLKCYSESLKTKFRSCQFPAKTSNSFLLYPECSPRSWTCSGSSYMTQHLFISMNHPIQLSLDHWFLQWPSFESMKCQAYYYLKVFELNCSLYLECSSPKLVTWLIFFFFLLFSGLSSNDLSSTRHILFLSSVTAGPLFFHCTHWHQKWNFSLLVELLLIFTFCALPCPWHLEWWMHRADTWTSVKVRDEIA